MKHSKQFLSFRCVLFYTDISTFQTCGHSCPLFCRGYGLDDPKLSHTGWTKHNQRFHSLGPNLVYCKVEPETLQLFWHTGQREKSQLFHTLCKNHISFTCSANTAHQVWNFTMLEVEFNLPYRPSCKPPSCVVLTAHFSDSVLKHIHQAHHAHSKFISIWNGALRDTHHSPGSQLTAMPGF